MPPEFIRNTRFSIWWNYKHQNYVGQIWLDRRPTGNIFTSLVAYQTGRRYSIDLSQQQRRQQKHNGRLDECTTGNIDIPCRIYLGLNWIMSKSCFVEHYEIFRLYQWVVRLCFVVRVSMCVYRNIEKMKRIRHFPFTHCLSFTLSVLRSLVEIEYTTEKQHRHHTHQRKKNTPDPITNAWASLQFSCSALDCAGDVKRRVYTNIKYIERNFSNVIRFEMGHHNRL